MKEFISLSQYLSYRPQCPFCGTDLAVNAELSLQEFGVEITKCQYQPEYIQFIFTGPVNGSTIDFQVRLHLDGKIIYKVLNPLSWEKSIEKKSFIDLFNGAHVQVFQECVNRNECQLQFFRQCLPLRITMERLETIKLYTESLTYSGFIVNNDYIEKKLTIYRQGSDTPPINVNFFDLNKETAQKFLNRIKVASVFS